MRMRNAFSSPAIVINSFSPSKGKELHRFNVCPHDKWSIVLFMLATARADGICVPTSKMRRGQGSLPRKQITAICDDLRDDSTVDVEVVVNVFSNAPSRKARGRARAYTS